MAELVKTSLGYQDQYGLKFQFRYSLSDTQKREAAEGAEGYNRVFICPDRTVEERISRQKLVTELKEKRSADPN